MGTGGVFRMGWVSGYEFALRTSRRAGMGCWMLSQPLAVAPTLRGDLPSGFGSTHYAKTSRSGQG